MVNQRPPDATATTRRAGLVGTLRWLDERLPAIRAGLPPGRVSILEVSLFCLLEHIAFRNPLAMPELVNLEAFVREFGARASAQATPYCFGTAA